MEQLDMQLEKKVVTKKGPWYNIIIGNEVISLGQRPKAIIELNKLIEAGKIEKLENLTRANDNQEPQSSNIAKEEIPAINEKLDKKDFADIYKNITSKLQKVSNFKDGDIYKVLVHGIDVNLKDHPIIRSVPFVFNWRHKKNSVKNGEIHVNKNWTRLSKKLLGQDNRTDKSWLEVMRDDTPSEDFYTIGDYELCVQDKKAYNRNKGIESLKNKLRPSEEIDKRTEQAKKMASLSKVDVDASVRGYESINSTDKSMVRESLVDNNKMSSAEATSLVNSMESLTDEEYEKQLNEMNKMIEAGKVGESVTNVKLVPINKI